MICNNSLISNIRPHPPPFSRGVKLRKSPRNLTEGHCHGDFAVYWSKLLRYLTKNLFNNMKLSLEHRDESLNNLSEEEKLQSVISRFSKILKRNLKKLAKFFQVSIHFHPRHPRSKMNHSGFCALVGLYLTKPNNYFNVCIHTNMCFWLFKVTIKIGDTAPVSFRAFTVLCHLRTLFY